MLCVCVCRCVVAYLSSFRCRSTSRYGYQVNFGCTFVYVYDCAIMSFLQFLVIGIGRPLFRNFGRTSVSVCVSASIHAQACKCMRRSVFCNRSSSGFRYLIDIIRACGCARARVRADARVCVHISGYKKVPEMSPPMILISSAPGQMGGWTALLVDAWMHLKSLK